MTAVSAAVQPHDLVRRMREGDQMLLVLRASLVGLLVISNDDPWIFGAVALTCLVVLPRPSLLRSPWTWGLLFVAIGVRQLLTWHTIDDHTIVMTYWCGALAVGLGATDPTTTLAASARHLIGSLFALAAGWKLLSGEFVDGSFFRYSLLFDDRFETVANLIGGTSGSTHDANIDNVSALLSDTARGSVTLQEGPRNELLARVFTWWGVLIESAVAVTFLLPLPSRWAWLRHGALIGFAATTYVVVPIGGFGTLLLVLGGAMVATPKARSAYLLGAAALLVWSVVWPVLFL